MTRDEHDDTIAMLRGAAGSGREATGADVAAAMRTGKKIRRRRRSLQAVGSGFVLSAGLGVIVVAGGMSSPTTEVVPASPAAPATSAATPTPGPSVATPPPATKPTLTPEDEARMAAAADMRHANNRLLLDALGKDWAATDDADPFGAELIRGTASDQGMPDTFSPLAGIEIFGAGTNISLADMCAPSVEKGLHSGACTPVDTGNGTVYVQRWTSTPGEWKPTGGRADTTYGTGTTVYLQRVDHSLVRVQMLARGAKSATETGQKTATAWLAKYDQTLEKVAADPRVQPNAKAADATSVAVSDHQRDQLILQKALGGQWTVGVDGPVALEPGSKKASELPSEAYGATAELSTMTDAAWRATGCGGKAHAAPCDAIQLSDDEYGEMSVWASRDATDNVMRGEISIFRHRKDGSWLVANVEVTGNNVTAAQSEDNKVVGQWLESLQDSLIKAITDPNVIGTPSRG